MSNVLVVIQAGLGTSASNGIIYDLAARLVRIDSVETMVGSYADYERFAHEVKKRPPYERVVQLGHSLGASVAPLFARLSVRPINGIFGFDPAENLSANMSIYRLTKIPPNVRVARAIYIPGGALGGGEYRAEDSNKTFVENWPIEDASHTKIEEAIEQHLEIEEFVRRLSEA